MLRLKPSIGLIAACAIVLAACQGGATAAPQVSPAPQVAGPTQAAPAQAISDLGPAEPGEYRLDTGDQLKVTVYGETELSGTFQVDGQGRISMGLIDEVTAKGLTIRQLQRLIEAKYADGYLRNPQVSAEMTNYRPYYIQGEITRAGEYPYVSGLTVMNAIAKAGDFTYRAEKRKVMIKHKDSTKEEEVTLTPNTLVLPGDTIRIKERFL